MEPIYNNNLSSDLQSLLRNQPQTAGVDKQQTNTKTGAGSPAIGSQTDKSVLSPYSQIVSALGTLQQTNPAEYGQITGQIATQLQKASTMASASGDTQNASSLTQLATVFQAASQGGYLPQLAASSPSSGLYSAQAYGPNIVGGADARSRIVGGADP